jgi:asparagine synthetase B (glutamine-hydrolysing)
VHDPEADLMKQMMYVELKQRLPELLLMRADKMSMAASIEAREPFLDHQLVEFMLNVPAALKFKNKTTKYLLKKVAEQFLPQEIIYRKKVGFGAPLASWLTDGQYFPAYFNQLSYDVHYATGADFATPLWQVDGNMNKNPGHRAVQNWVLQQLWTFTQQS